MVEMHVDWMPNVGDEPPDLDVTEARCGDGNPGLVRLVVDRPQAGAALSEEKRAGGDGAAALQCDDAYTELLWNRRFVGSITADDVEAHDLGGGLCANGIDETHAGAGRIAGEVDDDVEAFRRGDVDRGVGHWAGEKSTVTADLHECRFAGRRRVKLQPVAARVGGVEYPESVSHRVGFEHWPRC